MLQIIDDENMQGLDMKPEMISIELLLDYFVYEISYRNNFEFLQAVIRLFLKVLVFYSLFFPIFLVITIFGQLLLKRFGKLNKSAMDIEF